jgi:FkbM family methyltransferase
LDVGCFHPFIGSNTYKLFQRGWKGINIDLDFHTIDLFNYFRKNDSNINIGVSDKTGNEDLYFFHNRAAINTLSQLRGKNFKEIKKIKTDTLNNIIQATKFKDCKIDFLSVDVEGYEMQVLKDFNFKKYCPDLIVVEYLEPNLKQVEFHNQNLKNIFQSELYNFMIKNDYTMVNWLHSDLIFVSNRIREK